MMVMNNSLVVNHRYKLSFAILSISVCVGKSQPSML